MIKRSTHLHVKSKEKMRFILLIKHHLRDYSKINVYTQRLDVGGYIVHLEDLK